MPDVTEPLDDLSGVPRYRQAALIIEAEIRSGSPEPGKPAPSRKDLAGRFGIAQATAARVHALLADHGYVVTVPGVGMVVTPGGRWRKLDAGPPDNVI